ncbi:MAG: HNH endonuclease [Pseudomonadota bacterium]|nr:HNH endonuclease [Pseudomonadota bacterium]
MLELWLRRLRKLRVDRASKTPAPHKPLLLLAILDFVENGEIATPQVRLTPELAFRFLGYWEVVGARGRSVGRVELPFFHLQSDGILRHVAHAGLDVALASIRPTSIELLNRVISHAEIPEDLFGLMLDRRNRDAMRQTLINGDWFNPEEQVKLRAILGMGGASSEQAPGTIPSALPKEVRQGRDIRFRLQIVPIYGYACLLCGIKMLLPSGTTLVEAAHIHQFSHSNNDDITNGMALCRNHHWAFDQGLWTLGGGFEVIVAADAFKEEAPNQTSLGAYHSRRVDLSRLAPEHRPMQKHLDWHRKNRYLGVYR